MTSPLGLAKTKQREFSTKQRDFLSSFVLLLAYAWTMFLCLCYRVNQALSLSFTSYMIMIIKTYARAVSTSWFVNSFVFGKYKV